MKINLLDKCAFKPSYAFALDLAVLLIAFLLLPGMGYCQTQVSPNIIRLDPINNALGPTKAGDIFQEVNYIPLETKKESIFGAIHQLTTTNNHFIIGDEDTNCIFIFNKNGKFSAKINRSITQNNIFWVNEDKDEICFAVAGNIVVFYNYQGKKLREEKRLRLEFSIDRHFFTDNFVAYSAYAVSEKFFKDTVNKELIMTQNGVTSSAYLPYNMRNEALKSEYIPYLGYSAFYKSGNRNAVYYCRPYDYTVYELTKSSLNAKYVFVFPLANTFSSSEFGNSTFQTDHKRYFRLNPNKIYNLNHTYEIGNCLFFKLTSQKDNRTSYIYNFTTQNLISLANIVPDKISHFLPINLGKSETGVLKQSILACDGIYAYTSISSEAFLNQKKLSSATDIIYPEILKTYLRNAKMVDNPIIVQVRPKQAF